MKAYGPDGRTFLVFTVNKGERYGLDDCLTHDKDDPLVEFYDMTYSNRRGFDARGQFVTRYYAETLARESPYGLSLDGGIPVWSVEASSMVHVRAMCRAITRPRRPV